MRLKARSGHAELEEERLLSEASATLASHVSETFNEQMKS